MRYRVKSAAGYYARREGKPAWVPSRKGAKAFRSVKLAQGVVKLLRYNGIQASVERRYVADRW